MKKACAVTGLAVVSALLFSMHPAAAKETADQKFIKTALMGNMYEVEAGKLAAARATSPEVKNFGQKLMDDHQKANEELKPIAVTKNVEIPAALDKKHQGMIDDLSKYSGADFDSQYMAMMAKDHKKDVEAYKKEVGKSEDPQVKGYASKTLGVIEQHLATAEQLHDSMKLKNKSMK